MRNSRSRDTQKTQHGIETDCVHTRRVKAGVETLRKPSTGLKRDQFRQRADPRLVVETLRKPSTGLKRVFWVCSLPRFVCRDTQKTQHGIETGVRRRLVDHHAKGRDTQKTQHGIETVEETDDVIVLAAVETLRKPSTGLKLGDLGRVVDHEIVETLRKPSTGLKLPPSVWTVPDESSRHSENPARD